MKDLTQGILKKHLLDLAIPSIGGGHYASFSGDDHLCTS